MQEYQDIHGILLDMLKKVICACDELEIPYYLAEGSCLGAVRHHGFIPWDDDLDIAMPIDYLEKFREYAPPILGNNYKIRGGGYEDDNFRIINDGVVIRRPPDDVDKEDKLIHPWIDIFVLYGLPSRAITRFIHYRTLWFWHKVFKLGDQNHILNRKRNTISSIIIKFAGIIHTERFINKGGALRQLDRVGKKYLFEDSAYVVAFPTWYETREIMPKAVYGKGASCEFDNVTVRIPVQYDTYLKKLYGEYLKLPPEEERRGKHRIQIIQNKSAL